MRLSNEKDGRDLCPRWRVKRVSHTTMSRAAEGLPPLFVETVLERCGVPLFNVPPFVASECRSCARGWSVQSNRPATDEELAAAGVTP